MFAPHGYTVEVAGCKVEIVVDSAHALEELRTMSYQATVLEIMIASPVDIHEERLLTQEVIHEWNYTHSTSRKIVLMPVGWDTHSTPAMGHPPQAIINERVLESCDLLIGIFWTRIGTPTTEAVSGTAEEIGRHVMAGKPAMIYFSSRPVALDSVDTDQYEQLKAFEKRCQERGLIESFDSPEEFRQKLTRQLAKTINEDAYIRSLVHAGSDELITDGLASVPTVHTLSNEAQELLVEASKDQEGEIFRHSLDQGIILKTKRKQFGDEHDPRTSAIWKDALKELINAGLLEPYGDKGVIYRVTRHGYEYADRVRVAD